LLIVTMRLRDIDVKPYNFRVSMRLSPGTVVGSYEVVAAVGAGGMGEVYRARDTRLQRDAAIKILPVAFARDPERLARFEREARTLAALNHPHVAQVYGVFDVPSEGGSHTAGLVMEFVDGEDLSQRIARAGAVPVDDAISVALQVAEALEAAHALGIIHRDLKPANIKVRPDGQVKVLDFGLAKALGPEGGPEGAAGVNPTNSPTITSPFQMSQLGVILGTAAYMAPEQAKGKAVDKRADIWAFGCVLYEMLTATRAFGGEDVTDTLAAIVRGDPDWSRLPPDTPASVRTLLRRCLEKDPRERLPDVGAARLELRDASRGSAGPVSGAQLAPPRRPMLPWVMAFLGTLAAFLAVIGAVIRDSARPPPDTRVYKSVIVPPAPLTGAPVRRMQISPDGRRLAFVAPDASGQTVLWVHPLADAQSQPLRGTEGAGSPFWSPDSRWIAFQADGKLKKVEATGGTVTTIGDAVETPPGTWNHDNVILTSGAGNVIVRRSSSGGPPVPVTSRESDPMERIHITPFFLPDGRHFLYATSRIGSLSSTIYAASLDSTESTRLIDGGVPQYASGYLLFLRGSMLMAQRFDPDRLALSGEAVPLAEDVQVNTSTGTGAFSVSQTGELVYQTGASVGSRLTWFDRSGKMLGVVGDPGPYADVQLSPDGRWASATKAGAEGHADVWLIDVARSQSRRFTIDTTGGFGAVWRPGSTGLVHGVRRPASLDFVEQTIYGTGAATILSDGKDKYPIGFSPDGSVLLYLLRMGATRGRLWAFHLTDRTSRPLFPESDPPQQGAEVSPNGRWIAYTSVNQTGVSGVYVASFPDGTAKREIPSRGASTPHWRRDGKELFFTAPGRLMAVDVDTTGATLDVGAPHALFEVTVPAVALGMGSTYGPSPDGQRFLFNTWETRNAVTPITLVVNWMRTLRQ
jgi:Tol biopolymer transport system component